MAESVEEMGARLKGNRDFTHGGDVFAKGVIFSLCLTQAAANFRSFLMCSVIAAVADSHSHGECMLYENGFFNRDDVIIAIRMIDHFLCIAPLREIFIDRVIQKEFALFKQFHRGGADNDFRHGKKAVDRIGVNRLSCVDIFNAEIVFINPLAVFCDDAAASGGTFFHKIREQFIHCFSSSHTRPSFPDSYYKYYTEYTEIRQ